MREALRLALNTLDGEGTVLLAPIGTSFDLFGNYAERGAVFAAAARAIVGEHTAQEAQP